jgi:hypothetical protein
MYRIVLPTGTSSTQFTLNVDIRPALGPAEPPIQWVPGALSLGLKRPECEASRLSPSSAEIKNAWSYISTAQYTFVKMCLFKHRDNFTFTIVGCSEKGGFQMYAQWQGMLIVEMRRADKRTRNVGDNVAKCQERTTAVCDVRLQTMQEMQ